MGSFCAWPPCTMPPFAHTVPSYFQTDFNKANAVESCCMGCFFLFLIGCLAVVVYAGGDDVAK